jgi:peptidylprolyl isomerase domain and WD repeat-containing protein 1
VLQFQQQYLEALPSAQMYEKSYMHRDTITQAVVRSGRSCSSGPREAS